MYKEILLLTRLENLNLYGLNRLKYTTDKKERRRCFLLAGVWVFVILILLGYSGGYAYALRYMGLTHAVPALFVSLISLILLFFGMFSSPASLFRKNGYDFLSALPIRPFSIVASRLIRIYAEDLVICVMATLPAIGVYAYFACPDFLFFPAWVVSVLFLPLIPMSLSVLFGAVISLLSSVFKKKAPFQALITVLFVVCLLFGSSYLSKMEDELSLEAIRSITEMVLKSLEKTYLPAAWIGKIAVQKYDGLLPLVGFSIVLIAGAAFITDRIFPFVLKYSGAKSERKAFRADRSVKSASIMSALIVREFKRYFASNIYLLNTIISPVMAVGIAVMFAVSGVDSVISVLPFDLNFPLVSAFLIGAVSSLMPPSAISISMEGKTWWLIKTLPIETKHILGAKILMSVLMHAPFLLIAAILNAVFFAPDALNAVVMLLAPFALDIFACTWALFIGTKFPRFDWENEVYVVKQSAAAGVGGMTAPMIAIAFTLPVVIFGTMLSAVLSLLAAAFAARILVKIIMKTNLLGM